MAMLTIILISAWNFISGCYSKTNNQVQVISQLEYQLAIYGIKSGCWIWNWTKYLGMVVGSLPLKSLESIWVETRSQRMVAPSGTEAGVEGEGKGRERPGMGPAMEEKEVSGCC